MFSSSKPHLSYAQTNLDEQQDYIHRRTQWRWCSLPLSHHRLRKSSLLMAMRGQVLGCFSSAGKTD